MNEERRETSDKQAQEIGQYESQVTSLRARISDLQNQVLARHRTGTCRAWLEFFHGINVTYRNVEEPIP